MKLYLNELAPWERKSEYYHHIQLGKDVRAQTEAISAQTEAMIATQIASTSAIIVSQERIAEGVDRVAYGVDRVRQGIYELKAAFEWGISEVVWQIEQNREVLKNILEVLIAPLDTQAKERRKRAEEAYANGWIDDAEEEFLESEKLNKFDFTIHTSLAMIYLFHKVDKKKALHYFQNAIKYAKPRSPYHASYALLHKALIERDLGLIEEAEKSTNEAVKLSPDFAEALYQNATYNAALSNTAKSIANLEKSIKQDRNYCIKADNEKLFDSIRDDVNKLFLKLRDEITKQCVKAISDFELLIKNANAKFDQCDSPDTLKFDTNNFATELTQIRNIISRNSYFDALDAKKECANINKKGEDYIISAKIWLDDLINDVDLQIRYKKGEYSIKRYNKRRISSIISIAISILLGIASFYPFIQLENKQSKSIREIADNMGREALHAYVNTYGKGPWPETQPYFWWGIIVFIFVTVIASIFGIMISKKIFSYEEIPQDTRDLARRRDNFDKLVSELEDMVFSRKFI